MTGNSFPSPPDEKGAQRTAVVFISHLLVDSVLDRFAKLQRERLTQDDVYFAYDATDATPEEISTAREQVGDSLVTFQMPDVLDVDYPKPGVEPEQQTLVPGNMDLLYLHFSRAKPGYSRYWFIEYDVAYTGDWSELFRTFKQSEADVLGTSIVPYERQPDFYWWETFEPRQDLDGSEWLRGFFPIVRLSTRALESLDTCYHRGWSGHAEAVIPTLANDYGLVLEDIGGEGPYVKTRNRNRFYTSSLDRPNLSPGTFVYRPPRPRKGFLPDKLWHPVKPNEGYLSTYPKIVERWLQANVRWWSAVRYGISRLRSALRSWRSVIKKPRG